jgi:predicted outer membrane repeat protein
VGCSTQGSGGGLFGRGLDDSEVERADFRNNTAATSGGAVYLTRSAILLEELHCAGNAALAGGGGALFWHADSHPTIVLGDGGGSVVVNASQSAHSLPQAAVAREICGPGNRAAYGDCVASDYRYSTVEIEQSQQTSAEKDTERGECGGWGGEMVS